jgi:cytochrome c553
MAYPPKKCSLSNVPRTRCAWQGFAPHLAGQNAEYIEGQLAKFRQGDRRHAPEMTMVTRDLDPDQARAVAAYLHAQ